MEDHKKQGEDEQNNNGVHLKFLQQNWKKGPPQGTVETFKIDQYSKIL